MAKRGAPSPVAKTDSHAHTTQRDSNSQELRWLPIYTYSLKLQTLQCQAPLMHQVQDVVLRMQVLTTHRFRALAAALYHNM